MITPIILEEIFLSLTVWPLYKACLIDILWFIYSILFCCGKYLFHQKHQGGHAFNWKFSSFYFDFLLFHFLGSNFVTLTLLCVIECIYIDKVAPAIQFSYLTFPVLISTFPSLIFLQPDWPCGGLVRVKCSWLGDCIRLPEIRWSSSTSVSEIIRKSWTVQAGGATQSNEEEEGRSIISPVTPRTPLTSHLIQALSVIHQVSPQSSLPPSSGTASSEARLPARRWQ